MSSNKWREAANHLWGWYDSRRTDAVRIVLITYFQLSSSVYTAFPISLKANQAAGSTDATTAAATTVEQGNSSYTTTTTTTTTTNDTNNGRSVFVVAMEAMQRL